jgi:hypothetical protein
MRRLSIPLFVLVLAAVVAAPAGAKAQKCPSSKPYKVGRFCVKQSTFDGTGNVALILPTRNSKTGRITGQGVRIGLRATTTETCTDGTSQQLGGVGSLVSPVVPLKGAAFSGSAPVVSGGTTREVRGHFTAANKVLVELYRQSYTSVSGATCTAEWRNVTIKGK